MKSPMIQLHSLHTLHEQLSSYKEIDEQLSDAIHVLQGAGLPGPKHEEWKYFPLHNVLLNNYKLPILTSKQYIPSEFTPHLSNAHNLIIVNGIVQQHDFSNIPGLHISSDMHTMSYGHPKDNPFPLLNDIMNGKTTTIHIDTTYVSATPIHVIHVYEGNDDSPVMSSPALRIDIAEHAKAQIIESFHCIDSSKGLINANVVIHASSHSELHHVIIEKGLEDVVVVYNCTSQLHDSSIVQDHVIIHDSHAIRNTIQGVLNNENGLYNIYGVISADENSLIDNHTIVDHVSPHCASNELFKHVLNDNSTAVFNGKIFVRKDAQKTNAYQSNRTLLLSPKATINTKPQLEIYADDVKCSHGATTGSVDEEALYYLQARGIPKHIGMKLLTDAFIGEVIQLLDNKQLREYFTETIIMQSGDEYEL